MLEISPEERRKFENCTFLHRSSFLTCDTCHGTTDRQIQQENCILIEIVSNISFILRIKNLLFFQEYVSPTSKRTKTFQECLWHHLSNKSQEDWKHKEEFCGGTGAYQTFEILKHPKVNLLIKVLTQLYILCRC